MKDLRGTQYVILTLSYMKDLLKLYLTLASDYENELHRQFQRGRDTEFDRLLCALGRMAEFCLSSLIRHALDWRQMKIDQVEKTDRNSKRIEGIEYVFCHLIIESLQVLAFFDF